MQQKPRLGWVDSDSACNKSKWEKCKREPEEGRIVTAVPAAAADADTFPAPADAADAAGGGFLSKCAGKACLRP